MVSSGSKHAHEIVGLELGDVKEQGGRWLFAAVSIRRRNSLHQSPVAMVKPPENRDLNAVVRRESTG